MQEASRPAGKLSNIDFLRGVAALSVLIWHYQHFYYGSGFLVDISKQPQVQPFYELLRIFYLHGSVAVQFFWILSGFVFCHAYNSRRQVTGKEFFVARFARLYPLHFLTLCLVAVLQFVSLNLVGKFQIYQINDFKHFVMNILFASHWGFQDGFSYNAPIWSVSVEIVVYLIFFAVLKLFGLNWRSCTAWVIASLVLKNIFNNAIFDCSLLFSVGVAVNLASKFIRSKGKDSISSLVALTLLAITIYINMDRQRFSSTILYFSFAFTIFLAAALENMGFSVGRVGDELGCMTYSSYLLHVPIQIATILYLDVILRSREVISSSDFFIFYLLSVFFASALVYRGIELRLKRTLISRLL